MCMCVLVWKVSVQDVEVFFFSFFPASKTKVRNVKIGDTAVTKVSGYDVF